MKPVAACLFLTCAAALLVACGGDNAMPPENCYDFPTNATLVAQGRCEGRVGHECSGTIGLYRTPTGQMVIGIQDDFQTTHIPCALLYYSSRDTLMGGINPATDVRLLGGSGGDGVLWRFAGKQGYPLPLGGEIGRSWFFIYQEPFLHGETARAQLLPLPAPQ